MRLGRVSSTTRPVSSMNLTLLLLVAIWPLQNDAKKTTTTWKTTEALAYRYLSKSPLMDTYMTGFKWFPKVFASLHFDESSLSIGRVNQSSAATPSEPD